MRSFVTSTSVSRSIVTGKPGNSEQDGACVPRCWSCVSRVLVETIENISVSNYSVSSVVHTRWYVLPRRSCGCCIACLLGSGRAGAWRTLQGAKFGWLRRHRDSLSNYTWGDGLVLHVPHRTSIDRGFVRTVRGQCNCPVSLVVTDITNDCGAKHLSNTIVRSSSHDETR